MIASILVVAVLSSTQVAPLAGTLSVQSGEVRLERPGAPATTARRLTRLRVGDQLAVAKPGQITVQITSAREVWSLPANARVQVEPKSLKPLANVRPLLVRRIAAPRTPQSAPGGQRIGGVIRGEDRAIRPFGAVSGAPVSLSWAKASGTQRTTIQVRDSQNRILLPERNLGAASSATLDSKAAPVGVWVQVEVKQVNASPSSTVVSKTHLRVLPPSEAKQVADEERALREALESDPVALGMALGDLWAGFGMASRVEEAAKLAFGDDEAQAKFQTGQWLEQCGFAGYARTQYERAWSLGNRDEDLEAAIERIGGKAEVPEWEKLAAERGRLMKEQKFADALPLAQRVVELLQKERPESEELARGLDALARVSYFQSDLAGAQQQWEAALAIRGKLAPGSLDVATLLNNLGNLAADRGDLDGAQRRYEAALAIREKLAPGSLAVAASLNNLGNLAADRGDLDGAQRRYEAALAIREKLAPGSLAVAMSLNNLGNVAVNRGDLEGAQRSHEAALAIKEKLAPGSLTVAGSLTNLGAVAGARGDLEGAQRRYEAALAIQEKLAPGSLAVATSLNNLGNVAVDRGDLEGAQRRYGAALAIQEKLAPGSLAMADSLNNLGIVASARGDLEGAQRSHEAALAIREKLAPGSLAVALSLGNLGLIARLRGDLAEAQRLYEAALAIQEKLAPGSLAVAASLNSLGIVAFDRGDLEEAQRRYEAALAIREKLAPGSLDVAWSLGNLGNVAYNRADLEGARRRYEAALAIFEKLAPGSLDLALSLNNLGNVARVRGDEGRLGELHQRRLALAATLIGEQGAAMAGNLGAFGTEATKALARSGWLADPAPAYPFLPTLRGAGLALESRVAAARRAAEADEDVRQAFAAVQIATKAESDWAIQPRPEGMDEPAWTNELLDRRAKQQSAEAALARLLREKDPRLAADLSIETRAVQQGLGKDEALVEFLRISTWDDKAKKPGPDAYGAFLVRREGDVRFVRLGDAAEIDGLVREWHEAIAVSNAVGATEQDLRETEKQLLDAGKKLYAKLIKPLGKLPETLLVAPDSDLHSLPFAALHDGRRYLVETKAVAVLGSGRDLVEKAPTAPADGTVVIAAPQFDLTAAAITQNARVRSSTRSPNAKGTWDPLPGAADEGEAVAGLLGATLLAGPEATEEKLLAVKNPRVLHIATHGFFFPPVQGREDRESRMMTDAGRGVRGADSPMIRTGLILAGANRDQEMMRAGLSDGWATALEISQMDLRGTELVVLSACETGRGDARGSEGVFGLQRAFRFAGAQSLLMSLFKVPDEVPTGSTGLMQHFYGGWKPGDPAGAKLQSLRGAQLAMLKDPKTRHPRYWSAFVLMGDR